MPVYLDVGTPHPDAGSLTANDVAALFGLDPILDMEALETLLEDILRE